jgi:pullulanase/glycogen debranching enzyme
MPAPPLIRDIAKHPLLSTKKLIAEPWDIGMYQVGGVGGWWGPGGGWLLVAGGCVARAGFLQA